MTVRRTIFCLLAFTLVACGWASSTGAAVSRPTADAKPHVVEYGRSVAIRGHAGNRRGVAVALERDAFPFDSGFRQISRKHTGAHGAYAFHRSPTQAVRYRVSLPQSSAAASRTVRVFVEPRVARRRCNLCGASSRRTGNRTLRISFQLVYPASAFAREEAKPVFFYYGQRNRSSRPPKRLHLARTVRQHRLAHHRTRVAVAHRVHLPHDYRFAVAVCTRTSMRHDGLGLPGAPGSHGCGDHRITYRESRHWLG